MWDRPTFSDILKAKKRIDPYIFCTPLRQYAALSKNLGFEAYVKHENYQLTGAFKIRGGINLISKLNLEEGRKKLITASTGNHGLSIAYAAKIFSKTAIICVPVNSNPDKIEAIIYAGAKIISEGKNFDEARLNAEKIAEEHGYRYIHSGNEPDLIAGVGTIGLEIIEDLPDVEVIIVPVGGGSSAAGISTVVKAAAPDVDVIAVQAEKAPSVYLSWKKREIVPTDSADTFADGLANPRAFELPLEIILDQIDDFILVSEEEIRDAVRLYVDKAHTIAEGAGAASLAAGYKIKQKLKGKKVVLVLSGGNITGEMLRRILRVEA